MGRPSLTDAQVDDFRRRATDVAMRLFAEQGYEAFSLRTLARELGVSHATPYRYFRSTGEIFSAVRAESFRRFGAFLEARLAGSRAPDKRLHRLARAYFDFAQMQPAAFRLAFELGQPDPDDPGEVDAAAFEAWSVLTRVVGEAVAAGVLEGEPDALAHVLWAGVHGVAALELAGRLRAGREADALLRSMTDSLIRAHRPSATLPKQKRASR
jgi:AcrR family transcriptional regulator